MVMMFQQGGHLGIPETTQKLAAELLKQGEFDLSPAEWVTVAARVVNEHMAHVPVRDLDLLEALLLLLLLLLLLRFLLFLFSSPPHPCPSAPPSPPPHAPAAALPPPPPPCLLALLLLRPPGLQRLRERGEGVPGARLRDAGARPREQGCHGGADPRR
eukprot:92494-Pyramimonas_sp.AAC.1